MLLTAPASWPGLVTFDTLLFAACTAMTRFCVRPPRWHTVSSDLVSADEDLPPLPVSKDLFTGLYSFRQAEMTVQLFGNDRLKGE